MKYGMRKPSLKKSFKARTTGKAKRAFKRSVNPLYGKKGMGMIKNPERAIKNKIYRKTTFGVSDILRSASKGSGNRANNSFTSSSKGRTGTRNDDYLDDYVNGEYLDDYADDEYLDDYSDDYYDDEDQYDQDDYNEPVRRDRYERRPSNSRGRTANRSDASDAKKAESKAKLKKILTRILIVELCFLGALIALLNFGSDSHIYSDAKEVDVYNGNHTEVLGKSSELIISSDEVTEEALNDWYWNYVAKHDHMYDFIIYEDDPGLGVHAFSGSVQVNVELTQDEYGDYQDNGITDETYTLAPDEETQTLVRIGAD